MWRVTAQKFQATRRGFTLVELLVVIAIIGLLAGVVVVAVGPARSKARDARRVADIKAIRTALSMYYDDNGNYPASGTATAPNSGWTTSSDPSWSSLQASLAPYLARLPVDPQNESSGWPGAGNYAYSYFSLGYGCSQQWYMIIYLLENTPPSTGGARSCDGSYFNYGQGYGVPNIVTEGQIR